MLQGGVDTRFVRWLPFDGAETPSVILKILNEPPPPLKNHLQNFPPELEECVNRALTKDEGGDHRWNFGIYIYSEGPDDAVGDDTEEGGQS